MHRAEIDQEHNRLILRWIDSLSISDVDRLQAEVMSLLPKLKPGFDCISDIANMRPASRHVMEHIEHLQAFCTRPGCGGSCVSWAGAAVHISHRNRWTVAAEAGYTPSMSIPKPRR